MHYYQFHIGDYQRDTIHLDDMEDLAYRRLLDLYYKDEQPISLDLDRVAKLIRMRSHSDCIASVLREYFERTDDGWVNHRVESELQRSYAKSESAKRSAEARWKRKNAKKPKQNQEVNANAMRTDSEGNANGMLPITQYPLPNTHNKPKDLSPVARDDEQSVFDYWCQRMGKNGQTKFSPKRRKAVQARLKDGRTVDDLMKAIDGCASSPFNMGLGERSDGTVYNDLELICRNNENLERFMQIYERPPVKQIANTSNDILGGSTW